ncbi:MAG: HD domain-containing protein [Chloroflexota bacterium]
MGRVNLAKQRLNSAEPAVTTLRIDNPELLSLLSAIADVTEAASAHAWATGGLVRDLLAGRTVYDLDIAVDGDPLTLGPTLAEAAGGIYFALQEERGQARVLLTGRGMHIDLIPLRAPDIEADLRLRDYTIDALAASLSEIRSGEVTLIDPTGGVGDIAARVVRMTGEQQLQHDPLRMLRGARIATQLSFAVEAETAEAILRNAARLTEAAPERLRDEMVRIFSCENAGAGMRLLDELGLFSVLLPEMERTRGVEQPTNHHAYDVLGHSFATVEALDMLLLDEPPGEAPMREIWQELWADLAWCMELRDYFREEVTPGTTRRALLKFCGLLHDIAKPQTKSFEPSGRMRFFGHSDLGAEMATALLRRLRFSSREVSGVAAMIDAHLRPMQLGQSGQPTRRAVYRFFRDTRGFGIDTLFLAMADHLGSVGPRVTAESFEYHIALTSYILHIRYSEEDTVISPKRIIDGDDLMAAFALQPGELLGDLLEAVREAQAAGEVGTREQALELARAKLAEVAAAARQ